MFKIARLKKGGTGTGSLPQRSKDLSIPYGNFMQDPVNKIPQNRESCGIVRESTAGLRMQRFNCTNVVINPQTSAERGLQDIVCTASVTGMQDPAEELITV